MNGHRMFGPFVKIDRSVKHLKELNAAGERFSKTYLGKARGIVLYGEPNAKCSQYFIKADIQVTVPVLQWGAMVGDIVYAMRSALDQAVWLLSDDPGDWNAFPICRTEKEWITRSPSLLWGVPERFVASIEWAQPYRVGRDKAHLHPAAVLNELSNIDKHRTLPVLALVPSHGDFKVRSTKGIASYGSFKLKTRGALEQDAVLAVCDITPDGSGQDAEMDVKTRVRCDIGFGRGDIPSSIQRKPVVKTFAQTLGIYVSNTIHALAAQDGLRVTPKALPAGDE